MLLTKEKNAGTLLQKADDRENLACVQTLLAEVLAEEDGRKDFSSFRPSSSASKVCTQARKTGRN